MSEVVCVEDHHDGWHVKVERVFEVPRTGRLLIFGFCSTCVEEVSYSTKRSVGEDRSTMTILRPSFYLLYTSTNLNV